MALPYATVDQVYQIMRKKSDKTDTTTYVSTEKLNSFTKTGTGIEFSNSTNSSNNTKLTITTSEYGADFKLLTSQDSQYFPILETDSILGILSASTIFGNFGTDTMSYAMGYSYNGIFFNENTGATEKFTGIFSRNNQSESSGTYAGILLTKEQEYSGCGEFTIIPWDEMRPAIVYYPSSMAVTPENRYEFQLPKKSGTFALTSDIKATHHHTITIKEGTKIIFAANRELESATAATTLETLISTFAGTTTAGFGDYILLTVDTAAKLTKQDGTETDLSTLTVTISDTVK